MTRICLHLLISSLTVFGAATASAQAWSPEKTTFAKARMQVLIGTATGQAPAVSVGVSINGAPVFATGAGNATPGTPANENTGYQIGSVSKQLTAGTMLALIEKKGGNTFSLETKVMDTLQDSFPFSKSNKETIRNLLTQRTGYADYTKPPATAVNVPNLNAPIERQKLRGYVYALLRSFPAPALPGPGTKHIYNNTNYYLTSLMIEKLGGFADYRDAMKQYVFQPAGMTKSGFLGAPPAGVTMAKPPYDTANSYVNNPNWPRGAGDVISTASDVLKWHSALMADKLFSKQMRATMFTPPGDGYAMGWAVAVTPPYAWINHSGIIAGYTSFDGIFMNGPNTWVSVAALSSNDKVPVDQLAACFAQLAMDPSTTLKGLNPLTKLTCGISNKMFGP